MSTQALEHGRHRLEKPLVLDLPTLHRKTGAQALISVGAGISTLKQLTAELDNTRHIPRKVKRDIFNTAEQLLGLSQPDDITPHTLALLGHASDFVPERRSELVRNALSAAFHASHPESLEFTIDALQLSLDADLPFEEAVRELNTTQPSVVPRPSPDPERPDAPHAAYEYLFEPSQPGPVIAEQVRKTGDISDRPLFR
ncbi:hypothetical protein RAAC3_TM7C00001G0571 [Candidatus Saccharibacteria bacterium RAAC3_TM7_1]|nr:hypothetical protein RAAC3_TM7C00001G0571 [Candidatus Saccharibacteria bacterium RAAC3_TM7_1]HCZ28433.1 hypothetical protein [Candidatus Saccharibacteria bacterium]